MTTIATATGDVPIADLGITLTHEHLFINLLRERRGDGLVHDEGAAIEEVMHFATQGGGTIFDLTTAELTPGSTVDSEGNFDASKHQTRNPRNVEAIQRVSKATGINVVLGTGRYRDPFLNPDVIEELGIEGLADEMIQDLTEGIPGTSAKAGIIGEIGADKWFISELESKVFSAAAKAHKVTGAPIYTHATRWSVAFDQIELLQSEGADLSKVAIGHVDTVPKRGFAVEVAKHGVYVGIDTINSSSPHEVAPRVEAVMDLVRAGYLDRILLSHDVCLTSHYRANGGNGFGFVLDGFKESLLEAGLSENEFREITQCNPARMLS